MDYEMPNKRAYLLLLDNLKKVNFRVDIFFIDILIIYWLSNKLIFKFIYQKKALK